MLNALKRWISGHSPASDWSSVGSWAQEQGLGFKRAREGEGFVIDGSFESRPWRLEWGPPQRAYLQGRELRIRMELQLPSDMQMLIIGRTLGEALERETFERYTQNNQTLIDVSTPEEMRWLAMFPKATLELPKQARGAYTAVASQPELVVSWAQGAFAERLELAATEFLHDQPPFVLMTLRGRLYLRLQLDLPEPDVIAQALSLFQAAAHEARRLTATSAEGLNDFPSTTSTAWQNDIAPEDPKDKGRA